jgi:hypothetical protein
MATDPTRKRHAKIRDARGRLVGQLDPVALHVWHRYDAVDAETVHQIVEALEPGTAKMRRRMIVFIPGLIALVVFGIAALYYCSPPGARRGLISDLTNPIILVPNLMCCLFIPWIVSRQARSKRIQFAMLKFRRCPHCGYDLRLLPADPTDGATVCPECGCAWLIDDEVLSEQLAGMAPRVEPTEGQKRIMVAIALLLCVLALFGAFLALKM